LIRCFPGDYRSLGQQCGGDHGQKNSRQDHVYAYCQFWQAVSRLVKAHTNLHHRNEEGSRYCAPQRWRTDGGYPGHHGHGENQAENNVGRPCMEVL
jgi:hypothetical protein